MPGARDDSVLDMPCGERGPHVRAHIIDGAEFAVDVENRHDFVGDFERATFTRRNIADAGDRMKLVLHGNLAKIRIELDAMGN